MKKALGLVALAAVVIAAIVSFARSGGAETSSYRFVTIERGDLEAVVASTGSLSAVTTVQVGTQVSGQVAEIYADFNDRVRRGQLVARIDPRTLQQAVRDAEANLERWQADVAQREREFERTKLLHESQGVTDSEYDTAEYNLAVARASLKSALVSLERAQNNLAYADIYAPIDGVVIERNVDVGQTVAASLSAPQLFLIANDLSEMEILASVDESDIGRIEEGQTARFTVQAYPDETFEGAVRQVRLQSTTQENVVNYTVVIDVQNPDGRLLPGMTATVDFLIETATDVLKVPNAALRFRPSVQMMSEIRERMQARFQGAREGEGATVGGEAGEATSRRPRGEDSGAGPAGEGSGHPEGAVESGRGGAAGPGAGGFGQGGGRPGMGQLWYVDAEGNLAVARVRVGITDGQSTQIESRGVELEVGMEIIAGITTSSEADRTTTNPFQQQSQGGRRGPGRF
jgi:HlyD family secretion protein